MIQCPTSGREITFPFAKQPMSLHNTHQGMACQTRTFGQMMLQNQVGCAMALSSVLGDRVSFLLHCTAIHTFTIDSTLCGNFTFVSLVVLLSGTPVGSRLSGTFVSPAPSTALPLDAFVLQ